MKSRYLLVVVCSSLFISRIVFAQNESTAPLPLLTLKPLVTPELPAGMTPAIALDKPLSVQQACQIALDHQPGLALARTSEVSAQGRLVAVRSGQQPQISASGSAGHTESDSSTTGGAQNQTSVSLSLRKLLHDSHRTSALVSQARLQSVAASAGVDQTRNDLIFSVQQAYYDLLKNQQLLTVSEKLLESQRAHLEQAKARLSAGLAPRGDVVKAQTLVADALLNLATAQNNVAQSRILLNQTLGIDVRTPTLVEDQPEPSPPEMQLDDLIKQALIKRPEMIASKATLDAAGSGLQAASKTNAPSLYATGSYGRQGWLFPLDSSQWGIGVAATWSFYDSGLTRGNMVQAQSAIDAAKARLYQTEQTVITDVTQAVLNLRSARQKLETSQAEVSNAQESLRIATGRYEAGVGIFLEVTDAEASLLTAQVNLVSSRFQLTTALASLQRALGESKIPTRDGITG